MIRIELSFRNLLLLLGLLIAAWVLYLARDVVVLLVIAVMLMATLHPLVQLAERRGVSHSWAVALTVLSLVLVPLLIIAALTPLIIAEVRSTAGQVPALQGHIDSLLRHIGLAGRLNQAIARFNPQNHITEIAVGSAQQTLTIIIDVLTIIVIAGYLLADARRLQYVLHEFTPRRAERHIEPLLEGMERVVGGYIRGQFITSAMFGLYAFLLCLVLRVPDPLLLGIIAGVGDVIPIFGVPAAMIITILIALTQSVWQPLAVVAGYVIYGQIENHFIVPKIYARTVNLSPLMVIVATILGGALDGVVGILIGIPIVGVLKVVFDYIVAERLRSRQAAVTEMVSEPTDVIGQQETVEAHGGRVEVGDEGELPEEGAPPPTYSPFEPIPGKDAPPQPERTLSGVRYLTLSRVVRRRPPGNVVHLRGAPPSLTARRRRRLSRRG